MRLIIRDDPESASAYIAKYIIGKRLDPSILEHNLTYTQTES